MGIMTVGGLGDCGTGRKVVVNGGRLETYRLQGLREDDAGGCWDAIGADISDQGEANRRVGDGDRGGGKLRGQE
jgi:hypothetical protein